MLWQLHCHHLFLDQSHLHLFCIHAYVYVSKHSLRERDRDVGKILYKWEYISASTTEAQLHKNANIYIENPFSLKRKTTGQTSNNFIILDRDYYTQRYNLSKEKLFFSFHSLLSVSLCNSHNFLMLSVFFSSLLLAPTHVVLQDCTLSSLSLGFSLHQMAEWSYFICLHLFLSSLACRTLIRQQSNLYKRGLTFAHKNMPFTLPFWQACPGSSFKFVDFSVACVTSSFSTRLD